MDEPFGADNAGFLGELYRRFLNDPESLDLKWRRLFRDFAPPASSDGAPATASAVTDSIKALTLIEAYRTRGHLAAKLDPLGLDVRKNHPELDPASYGFTPDDYDREILIDGDAGVERATLRTILERSRKIYGGFVGVEFAHAQNPGQRAWVQSRIENDSNDPPLDLKKIFYDLTRAEAFEKFLNVKFPGAKRFGIEGGESLIPAFERVLEFYADNGVDDVNIGMPHRGRLCLLANIMGKPIHHILAMFMGQNLNPDNYEGSGDVKYHVGYSADREINGKKIHLSLTANPSHLEAVNSVTLGKTRAKQDRRKDRNGNKTVAVLLHGDAAFAGQGAVAESLSLCGLEGYETGGTLHFIVNNQIGFTTSPPHSRSSPYPSDAAKAIQAPIFHVNGDHPEEVVRVALVAAEFTLTFGVDAVVDITCYRRFGHNEGDEPAFTQPIMYKTIAAHKTTPTLFAERLEANEAIDRKELDEIAERVRQNLNKEFEAAGSIDIAEKTIDWFGGAWENVKSFEDSKTGVELETLKNIGLRLSEVPERINVNPKLARVLAHRREAISAGVGIDWATAEALAFGSLALEGYPVRLSGQDSCRGTFSQRHAAIIDQVTEERYVPLNNLGANQARFDAFDSPLAEGSILGFEYGYSSANPNALVLWEAQFGDFANGAQVVIDQFVSSAERKWARLSGLTMLLPHGFEGQGPEHSSARLERYLQLCAEDNLRVINCTTPANYFHALRNQLKNKWRKPLAVMTPKSLLRHKSAVSTLEDMKTGTSFREVIGDDSISSARRVIVCGGKVYYDLVAARSGFNIGDIAIVRLERFYPFPEEALASALEKFGAIELVWCQEEPRNMGAWNFLDRRLEGVLKKIGNAKHPRPYYAGREESASPATGIPGQHEKEQNELLKRALIGVAEA